jgi:integrase
VKTRTLIDARPDIGRLLIEVENFRGAEMAPTTEYGYAHDWRLFSQWCEHAGRTAMPATPETLALFLADRLREKKVNTVCRYAAGISYAHSRAGLPSPLDNSVRRVLTGARRMRAETLHQMQPITVAQVRDISDKLIQRATPWDIRDLAVLLIAFSTGLRRINLCALRMEDVGFCEEGVIFRIRTEKQDRRGIGRWTGAARGQNAITCPVRALEAWLAIRTRQEGALFSRLDNRHVGIQPLSPNGILYIVKKAVAAIGLDPTRFGPHSCRAGLITESGILGVSHLVIANHVGHKSLDSTLRYFRPTEVFRTNCAARLGL